MYDIDIIRITVFMQSVATGLRDRLSHHLADMKSTDERGEGVISAAIAVLIMAVIGAAMFVAYKKLFDDTNVAVNKQLETITNP